MRVHPKYSGLVPPSIQQLWWREAPVDGRTAMSIDSVCQVACSWVDVGSLHMRLFGVVYFAIDSVQEFLDTPSYSSLVAAPISCNTHLKQLPVSLSLKRVMYV
jgi:hypothetical protein